MGIDPKADSEAKLMWFSCLIAKSGTKGSWEGEAVKQQRQSKTGKQIQQGREKNPKSMKGRQKGQYTSKHKDVGKEAHGNVNIMFWQLKEGGQGYKYKAD